MQELQDLDTPPHRGPMQGGLARGRVPGVDVHVLPALLVGQQKLCALCLVVQCGPLERKIPLRVRRTQNGMILLLQQLSEPVQVTISACLGGRVDEGGLLCFRGGDGALSVPARGSTIATVRRRGVVLVRAARRVLLRRGRPVPSSSACLCARLWSLRRFASSAPGLRDRARDRRDSINGTMIETNWYRKHKICLAVIPSPHPRAAAPASSRAPLLLGFGAIQHIFGLLELLSHESGVCSLQLH